MFPKSLVFAFVASCLFLAKVDVEASSKPNRLDTFDSYLSPAATNLEKRNMWGPLHDGGGDPSKDVRTQGTVKPADRKPRRDTNHRDSDASNYQGAPSSITITSTLAKIPYDKGFLGICTLQFTAYDGIYSPDNNPRGSMVQAFMTEAQKSAQCSWTSPTNIQCEEKVGKVDMSPTDTISLKQTFCRRCSDAGGKNRKEFACPKDPNGAKTEGSKDVKKGSKDVKKGSKDVKKGSKDVKKGSKDVKKGSTDVKAVKVD
ncbi:hypothetical protein NDA18_005129 [Ustilago nuda]|nr:hypothetical protein NDA18_005129 [Ustilago nuda]